MKGETAQNSRGNCDFAIVPGENQGLCVMLSLPLLSPESPLVICSLLANYAWPKEDESLHLDASISQSLSECFLMGSGGV